MSGKIHARTLYQDKIWIDVEGAEHDLETMDPRHRSRLIPFLERRAAQLQFAAENLCSSRLPDLSYASDGVFNALSNALDEFERQPIGWLQTTPLMRRLRELVEA